MTISVTDKAAEHMNKLLSSRGKGIGIRLGVKNAGCSGMAYVIEYVDELVQEDQVFEDKGVKIIIDSKSLPFVNGTEIDFQKQGLNEAFTFNNPNAKASCGCGESFSV
jgi:iron-sulfur cluster assembly protein